MIFPYNVPLPRNSNYKKMYWMEKNALLVILASIKQALGTGGIGGVGVHVYVDTRILKYGSPNSNLFCL